MRHYQRLQQQVDSSFIRNMVTCYTTMARFYTGQFLKGCTDPFENSDSSLVWDIRQVMLIIEGFPCYSEDDADPDIVSYIGSVDAAAAAYYHSSFEMKQLHPGLEKLLHSTTNI
jgi:hypothetical protein